jgi:single-stranded-DNA-specific exonuclease
VSYLGVEQSITGRRWVGPGPELDRAAEALVQAGGYPRALAAVLARRGVAPHEAEGFLKPALRDLLPDPRSLRDMEAAAARLLAAVERRERVAIFADYDVDGGCVGGAADLVAAGAGTARDALCSRPHRRGLWPERACDADAGGRP